MEIAFELGPTGDKAKLEERLKTLSDIVDWVDIPDSPMGTSRFFSPIVSCIAKQSFSDVKVIAHVRVIDLSRVALEAVIKGLSLCGVERVVFVRGDIVEGSTIVRDLEPEQALNTARAMGGPSPGLLLSMRKSLGEIKSRLDLKADFYLVLNLNSNTVKAYESVVEEAGKVNAKLYPYIVLLTENNRSIMGGLISRDKMHTPEEAVKLLESNSSLIDRVLVSSPMDFKGGLKFVEKLRRK